MAEEKKKSTEPFSTTTAEELTFLLAGLVILAVILNRITAYLYSMGWSGSGADWAELLKAYFWPFWSKWKVIAVAISAACVAWAAYSLRKLTEINKEENRFYGLANDKSLIEELTEKTSEKKNEKWLRVTAHINSENSSDWRLAIIEADVMLEELLHSLGYMGDTVADMLKSADKSNFLSLEAAWEAHKIRNRIAHDGSAFELSEREARRTITLFETVFKEAKII